jgi:hypothetical protein
MDDNLNDDAPEESSKQFNFDTLNLPIEKTEWMDADGRIFLACFTILGQFVENELGTKPWSYQTEDCMYRGYRQHFAGDNHARAIDLWLWYKDELPKIVEEVDADIHRVYGGDDVLQFGEINPATGVGELKIKRNGEPKFPYDYVESLKTEKLNELMKLRAKGGLWT